MKQYIAIYNEDYTEIIGYNLDGTFIPIDRGNKDYNEMLELARGGLAEIVELTEEELVAKQQEIANQKLIEEAKRYLKETDWIVVKINEYQLSGEDISPLLDKYAVELQTRKEKRDLINELGG